MGDSIEQRLRRVEDRQEISECVIRYAISLDTTDWDLFRACITDPGFDQRQHISPNHVVEFRSDDEAVCHSYMYAQHQLAGAPGGDFFLMRGSYTNVLRRTPEGWAISSMTQHFGWGDGNDRIFETSRERGEAASRA